MPNQVINNGAVLIKDVLERSWQEGYSAPDWFSTVAVIKYFKPKFDKIATFIEFKEPYILEGDFSFTVETSDITLGGGSWQTIVSGVNFRVTVISTDGRISISTGSSSSNSSGFIGFNLEKDTLTISRKGSDITVRASGGGSITRSYSDAIIFSHVGTDAMSEGATDIMLGSINNIYVFGDIWLFNESFGLYPNLSSNTGKKAIAYNFKSLDLVEITNG